MNKQITVEDSSASNRRSESHPYRTKERAQFDGRKVTSHIPELSSRKGKEPNGKTPLESASLPRILRVPQVLLPPVKGSGILSDADSAVECVKIKVLNFCAQWGTQQQSNARERGYNCGVQNA